MVIDFRPLDAGGKPAARQICNWPEWYRVYVQVLTADGILRFGKSPEILQSLAPGGQRQGLVVRHPGFDFRPGTGTVRTVTFSVPAAGAEAVFTVPANTIWRLITAHVLLVTSAQVATRNVSWVLLDAATNLIYAIFSGKSQVASETLRHEFAVDADFRGDDGAARAICPAPPLMLAAGFVLNTSTGGLQTLDQFSQLTLLVEEWDTSAAFPEIAEFSWRGPLWGIADSGVVQAEIETIEDPAPGRGRFDHAGDRR